MSEEQKKKVGRPLKFETPEVLQQKIDEYFRWADGERIDKEGNKIMVLPIPYTIERLAVFLDCDRDLINEYEDERPEYTRTITRARRLILASKMERLNTTGTNTKGIIFDLSNNHNLVEKKEITSANKNENDIGDKTLLKLTNIIKEITNATSPSAPEKAED